MITQENVRNILDYNPDTGVLTWKIAPRGKTALTPAGHKAAKGYISIGINRKYYKAHRIIWLYVYGKFPTHAIDHINGDRTDNRLQNLREATIQENSFNRKLCRNSIHKGVSLDRRTGRFYARITVGGETKYLGFFATKQEAIDAREEAAKNQHGEFYYKLGVERNSSSLNSQAENL